MGEMSFFLKKLIGVAVMPLSLLFIILAIGVLFLWFERLRFAGRWLVTASLVLFLVVGYGIPLNHLALTLESQYPPALKIEPRAAPQWIIVLGGGHRSQSGFPLSSRVMEDSLYRLVEGIRLHRQIPGSRLVLLGGALFDSVSVAKVSADLAESLGVEPGAIVVEEKARDTAEEALRIRQMVGDAPFFLVTAAMHMPRAVFHFEKLGMRPIPAPTQHRIRLEGGAHPARFFPSAEKISVAHAVVYEMVGTWWERIRDGFTR